MGAEIAVLLNIHNVHVFEEKDESVITINTVRRLHCCLLLPLSGPVLNSCQ